MTADVVKQIRRATRRRSEGKTRILLKGVRGEIPVTELWDTSGTGLR